MKQTHVILGVHVRDRIQDAGRVQQLFGEYGCNIRTRVGLHQVDDDFCSPGGVILLEIHGGEAVADELAAKLNAIEAVEVQKLVFAHPGE